MANPSPALNPNPPKFVTGAQIKGARALLGWRRTDLARAAGLHRNAVAYWEGQTRFPRQEPFACRKMRDALLAAGVVTVSTPAPGVCLLPPERRPIRDAGPKAIPLGQTADADGRRFITAFNGPEVCTMHSGTTVSTAQELEARSTVLDCAPDTTAAGDGA